MKILEKLESGYIEVVPVEIDRTGGLVGQVRHSYPVVCCVRIVSTGELALAHGLRFVKYDGRVLLPMQDLIQYVELEEGEVSKDMEIVPQSVEEFTNMFAKRG